MKIAAAALLSSVLTSLFFIYHPVQSFQESGLHSRVLLQTTTSWDGRPIIYPEGEAEITAVTIELDPGAETGWHHHPVPSFAYVLQGNLEVQLEDGNTVRKTAGDVLAEVTNTVHSGKNTGAEPLKLVVFYMGATGSGLTIMQD